MAARNYIYKILLFLMVCLPPVVALFYMINYSVNIPYMDQWDGFLNILVALREGSFGFAHLWAQHNEHRILFPKIIMLFLALLSHWNVIWEQYFSLFLQICTFLLILNIKKLTSPVKQKPVYFLFIIITSMLFFSMVQYENWVWGWQIQIFLNIFSATFSIWIIIKYPDNWTGLLLAIVGAIIATYSFANGMIIWAIIFMALLLSDITTKKIFIAIWITAALAVSFSYLYEYEKPLHHPSLFSFINHPLDYIIFFFSFIGAPMGVCFGLTGSAIIGVTGISIFIILLLNMVINSQKHPIEKYIPWICLILYALITAAITGIGRSGFSANQALYSRYTSFSLLFWVSLYTMFLVSKDSFYKKIAYRKLVCLFCALLFSCLIISHSISYSQGIMSFKKHSNRLSEIRELLKYAKIYGANKSFAYLFPSIPELYERLDKLRQLKLAVYYKEITTPSGMYIKGDYFLFNRRSEYQNFSKNGDLYLEKDHQVSGKIEVSKSINYNLMSRLLFSSGHGSVMIIIDNSILGVEDCSSFNKLRDHSEYKWVSFGQIFLSKGYHTITIKSLGEKSFINAIVLKEKI